MSGQVIEKVTPLEIPSSEHTAQVTDKALAKAKCAVAEYLRDLGLRDPDVLARESQRIVKEAHETFPHDQALDESVLCQTAIGLTVRRLERWLLALAEQSLSDDQPERLGNVIGARLHDLLDQFPDALNHEQWSSELVDSLPSRVTAVVPPSRPRSMRRQSLAFLPVRMMKWSVFQCRLMLFRIRDGISLLLSGRSPKPSEAK